MTIAKSATPRDAMYELASVGIPDADLLESVIRRHPDHAADLTEFAVELALDALRGAAPVDAGVADVGPSAAVSRAISRFQNKLHEARTAVRSGPSAPPGARAAANPFADLDRTAFRDLAGRLGVSTVFAVKGPSDRTGDDDGRLPPPRRGRPDGAARRGRRPLRRWRRRRRTPVL
jgi:hypothetical protein